MWGTDTLTDVVNPGSFGYTEFTYDAVAGAPDISLSFEFKEQEGSFNSFVLDDVSVTKVPDGGATLGLLGMVLLGLFAARRKFAGVC